MADKPHKNHNDNNKEHQPLLVLGPPFMFPIFEAQNLHNYHFLNAFSSFKTFLLLIMLGNGILLSPAIFLLAPSPRQKISADFIGLLPLLSLIVTSSAGTDHIDLVECSRHGIQVVSVPGDQAKDVADMAGGC
ncbi:Glyoxylate/hydroxypyruvate reductase HPR3 isoform E [Glycine soja]|uniref:Glyoxylate/hydroxypyruvate reductase HPR3 isoform E n=1 Tax=Glycine soja TaxID=3848 RepID=A0A445L667_GLYSO|nr:Glyoxylate/hydroxypyruvate reductase HPR3 isoform E [Glycine soja]